MSLITFFENNSHDFNVLIKDTDGNPITSGFTVLYQIGATVDGELLLELTGTTINSGISSISIPVTNGLVAGNYVGELDIVQESPIIKRITVDQHVLTILPSFD